MKSLDAPADADAADAWDKEISLRLDEIDAGTAKLIDRAELRRRIYPPRERFDPSHFSVESRQEPKETI